MNIHYLLARRRRSQNSSPLDTTATCESGTAALEVKLLEKDGASITAPRDLAGASRLVWAWFKQLPLQPLMAALTVALIIGAIPLILAALLCVGRVLLEWYRQVFRPRNDAVPFEKFTNHVELL